jgi:putative polysaccharide biosynthesis protein
MASIATTLSDLAASLREAKRQTGKGVLDQLLEIRDVRRRARMFGLTDYFDYRLFDDAAYQGRDKADVAGWRMEDWLADVLNGPWHALVRDKVIFYALLQAYGLPYPRVYAIYQQAGQRFPGVPTFRTFDALLEYVRDEMPYPFFAKPSCGDRGYGAFAIRSYDRATSQLIDQEGRAVPFSEFAARLHDPKIGVEPGSGYVFAEQLRQHEVLRQMCGNGIASIHLVLLVHDEGAVPFRALWKVVGANNVIDHYRRGTIGNLLAAVDVESGEVIRVISGYGLSRRLVERHPDSGIAFAGFRLPQWDDLVGVCREAALLFPGIRIQHWDVALSDRGPVLLEMNSEGAIDFLQFAHDQGLFDSTLRAFVAKYGDSRSRV